MDIIYKYRERHAINRKMKSDSKKYEIRIIFCTKAFFLIMSLQSVEICKKILKIL